MPRSDKSASGTTSPCHCSRTVTASRVAGTGQNLTRPDSENMPEPPDQVERPRDQPRAEKAKTMVIQPEQGSNVLLLQG